MSKLRAADDIQKGDWVVSHDGTKIYESYLDNLNLSNFHRILAPGDMVPVGAVLLRILPGSPEHMSELVAKDTLGPRRDYGTRLALKSLPAPKKSRDELRDDVVDAAMELRHSDKVQAIDSLCDAVEALEASDE